MTLKHCFRSCTFVKILLKIYELDKTILGFNLHWDLEANKVFSGVILQHPLALYLECGELGQDGDGHVVDQLLAHLHAAVAHAQVLARVDGAAVEGQLDPTHHDTNNLTTCTG